MTHEEMRHLRDIKDDKEAEGERLFRSRTNANRRYAPCVWVVEQRQGPRWVPVESSTSNESMAEMARRWWDLNRDGQRRVVRYVRAQR